VKEIIKRLYLGSEDDVPKAQARGMSRLACCKDGIDSHRSLIGYTTMGAPKDQFYYAVKKGNVVGLNLIDSDNPEFIPKQVIDIALKFIKHEQDAGRTIFVHCNAGMSRSPSIVLMYLRAIGEMPWSYLRSQHVFKTIYPKYSPGTGMRTYSRTHWDELEKFFQGK
jgi:hypothetical protein